ncbi:hypothetical protein FJT64_004266 [Amphibalanus amphitrite]|uniref:Uncharacterized protein n=1 Tax=Amphibalanus amphitrite TaxID=1232801 RepID=A0A6A4VZQ5_AMPAM|nr:hypothetical protein FJT64_004266 [Amphibalanus amphitrite]
MVDAAPVFQAQEYDKELAPLAVEAGIDAETEEGLAQIDAATRIQFHRMVVAIGTLCLAYGYSQDTLIAKQISRRLAAAYADANLAAPDWDGLTSAIKEWVGSPREINSEVVALLGSVVALHKNGGVDTTVTADEEAVASEDERLRALPPIFAALRDQMLLVYTNYQSSTIRWALQVLPLVEEAGFGNNHWLKAEIDHLKSIRTDVEGRRFAGMVTKIATRYQQQQFPMLALIGCQYHSRYLETEDQRAAFREFNITGILQRVADTKGKPICDAVIDSLPAPQVEAKASLMKGMSALDAERLLQACTEEDAKFIKERLHRIDPPCPWAIHDAKVQAAEAKKRFYQAAAAELNKRWEQTYSQLVDKLALEDDAEARKTLQESIRKLRSELSVILAAEEMTGAQLMQQLRIKHQDELETHWEAGMAIIRRLRTL